MKKAFTLSDLLDLLNQDAHILAVHHMGANCYEAIHSGTVRDAMLSRCVEVCGDHQVEKIAVDVDDWPDTPTPVLIITIGEKVVEK